MPKAKRRPAETPFEIVNEMEEDVASLIDYGHVVARLAQTLEVEEAGMFAQIGWRIIEHAEAVKIRRGQLLDALFAGLQSKP